MSRKGKKEEGTNVDGVVVLCRIGLVDKSLASISLVQWLKNHKKCGTVYGWGILFLGAAWKSFMGK